MKYIDNGTGDPREDALFTWLRDVLTEDVVGIRWQSGFFEASVLGVFMPTLQRLAEGAQDAIVLIGSNEGGTQSSAVHQLVDVLGLPRPNARLGVVSYADGFYHPKTIHVCYHSGREVAYVGSANMTSRGINGLNIEAGIVFDTDEGDPVELPTRIRLATDRWFVSHPEGLFEVEGHHDVSQLEGRGILTAEHAPGGLLDQAVGPSQGLFPRRIRHHALPLMPDRGREEDDAIDDESGQGAGSEGNVLIAELAGPGRWGQAAFPEWFVNHFFQVLPNRDDVLRLWPVTQADGVGAVEEATCGFKPGSKNWYYELGLAAAIGTYPQPPAKPIGVFLRIGHQTFRYTILMPDDESYPHVADCLAANRNRLNRPRNQLPRTIVSAEVLRNAWPEDWFFRV